MYNQKHPATLHNTLLLVAIFPERDNCSISLELFYRTYTPKIHTRYTYIIYICIYIYIYIVYILDKEKIIISAILECGNLTRKCQTVGFGQAPGAFTLHRNVHVVTPPFCFLFALCFMWCPVEPVPCRDMVALVRKAGGGHFLRR